METLIQVYGSGPSHPVVRAAASSAMGCLLLNTGLTNYLVQSTSTIGSYGRTNLGLFFHDGDCSLYAAIKRPMKRRALEGLDVTETENLVSYRLTKKLSICFSRFSTLQHRQRPEAGCLVSRLLSPSLSPRWLTQAAESRDFVTTQVRLGTNMGITDQRRRQPQHTLGSDPSFR